MKWYKRTIVLAIGLMAELIFAALSAFLIRANGDWVESLVLPYFALRSPLLFAALSEITYLFSALSLAAYAERRRDLPKGVLCLASEGVSEIAFLCFFFELTYEISSFFIATACMVLSFINLWIFSKQNYIAVLLRLPVVLIKVYLWTIIYCILTLNFT